MARFFQEEIGQGEGDRQRKKNKAEKQAQNTQEDEPGSVHTLSPKQKAEYESLDKEQKKLVKYVLGIPGAEIDFALRNGYTKIAKRLERLRFERRQELYGTQRSNKTSHE